MSGVRVLLNLLHTEEQMLVADFPITENAILDKEKSTMRPS